MTYKELLLVLTFFYTSLAYILVALPNSRGDHNHDSVLAICFGFACGAFSAGMLNAHLELDQYNEVLHQMILGDYNDNDEI
jgi:hypothetical protein